MCHLPKFHDDNLIVGFDTSDDASVYKIDENTALIQTVDIFPPVVDDPYDYGRIAAANSLSDVYAMGGRPKLAMNIFCYPEDLPIDMVQGILQGGYEKVAEADAIVTGGHTIKDAVPKYGLSVSGFAHPSQILTNSGAKEGDVLILTKPLGSGILNTAAKAQLAEASSVKALVDVMAALNRTAAEIASDFPVHACTDITGFGFLGHVCEMARGSFLAAEIYAPSLPLLPQAQEFAEMGIIPAGAYSNRSYLDGMVTLSSQVPLALADVMFDPQTSGGLLYALPEKDAARLLSRLQDALPTAEIVGFVKPFEEYFIEVK